jgi:hypothetical protein
VLAHLKLLSREIWVGQSGSKPAFKLCRQTVDCRGKSRKLFLLVGWTFYDVAKRSDRMGKWLFPMKLKHRLLVACRCVRYEIRQHVLETQRFCLKCRDFYNYLRLQCFSLWTIFRARYDNTIFFKSGTYSLPTGIAFPLQVSHLILHLLMDMVATTLPSNLRLPSI